MKQHALLTRSLASQHSTRMILVPSPPFLNFDSESHHYTLRLQTAQSRSHWSRVIAQKPLNKAEGASISRTFGRGISQVSSEGSPIAQPPSPSFLANCLGHAVSSYMKPLE